VCVPACARARPAASGLVAVLLGCRVPLLWPQLQRLCPSWCLHSTRCCVSGAARNDISRVAKLMAASLRRSGQQCSGLKQSASLRWPSPQRGRTRLNELRLLNGLFTRRLCRCSTVRRAAQAGCSCERCRLSDNCGVGRCSDDSCRPDRRSTIQCRRRRGNCLCCRGGCRRCSGCTAFGTAVCRVVRVCCCLQAHRSIPGLCVDVPQSDALMAQASTGGVYSRSVRGQPYHAGLPYDLYVYPIFALQLTANGEHRASCRVTNLTRHGHLWGGHRCALLPHRLHLM
jgi:hypothetical protein